MIRPVAGGASVWACMGPDRASNKNNKTPATGLEYLNFLKVVRMDGNDKRKLRPNNGISALFLYRKEIVGWIVVGKAESIVSEDDDFSSKIDSTYLWNSLLLKWGVLDMQLDAVLKLEEVEQQDNTSGEKLR
jgi:hypothetical protein